MAVLTIRTHKRYAVRQPVRLGKSGAEPARGLMIELSSEGCRISGLSSCDYAIGEEVTLELGELSLGGRIRWAHDGIAGVRLVNPLYPSQLGELIARDRGLAQARVA
jgi:hypothetical protein